MRKMVKKNSHKQQTYEQTCLTMAIEFSQKVRFTNRKALDLCLLSLTAFTRGRQT